MASPQRNHSESPGIANLHGRPQMVDMTQA